MTPASFSSSRPGREPRRGRAVPAVLLVAALAAAAAACSSPSSSGTTAAASTVGASAASASASASAAGTGRLTGAAATALLAKAVADTKAAPSVEVKTADIPDGTAGQLLSFDLTMVRKVGCEGSIAESKTQTFQLVARDGFIWMKPSSGFVASLKLSQAEMALVANKWIKAKSTDTQLASFAALCNFSSLLGSVGSLTGASFVATPTTYEGHSAYKVIQTGQPGYAYVINSATPTLAELDVPGKTGGEMSVTASGTPGAITEPPAAESIDGSAFGF